MNTSQQNREKKHSRMPFPFPLLGAGSGEEELEELYAEALADGGVCESRETSRSVEVLSIDGTTLVRPIRRGSRVIEVDLA